MSISGARSAMSESQAAETIGRRQVARGVVRTLGREHATRTRAQPATRHSCSLTAQITPAANALRRFLQHESSLFFSGQARRGGTLPERTSTSPLGSLVACTVGSLPARLPARLQARVLARLLARLLGWLGAGSDGCEANQ